MWDLRAALLWQSPYQHLPGLPELHPRPEVSYLKRMRAVMAEFDDTYDNIDVMQYDRILRSLGFVPCWAERFYSPVTEQEEYQQVLVHPRGIVLVWETLDTEVASARWYANYHGPLPLGSTISTGAETELQIVSRDAREGMRWVMETTYDHQFVRPMLVTPYVWSVHHGNVPTDVEIERERIIRGWPQDVRTMLGIKNPLLLPRQAGQ
jgi:hypothetical protein